MTNKCGDCKWLVTKEGKPYYCAIKDLYTIKGYTDDACEEFLEADDGKSDVYRAIIKIKEYCFRQLYCKGCKFRRKGDRGEFECNIGGIPDEWNTDDIPCNILEEEE